VVRPANRLAGILFIAGLIPLMVTSMVKVIPLIGNGTLAAMLAFSLIALASDICSANARRAIARRSPCRRPRVILEWQWLSPGSTP
jgi:hypothetical protein